MRSKNILLSTYYVPATVLGTGDTAVTQKVPISALVNSVILLRVFHACTLTSNSREAGHPCLLPRFLKHPPPCSLRHKSDR